MIKRAQVLTAWVGSGTTTRDQKRPKIGDDYPLLSCVDVTGLPFESIPPSPNVSVAEITCDDTVLQQIANDPQYGPILWERDAQS